MRPVAWYQCGRCGWWNGSVTRISLRLLPTLEVRQQSSTRLVSRGCAPIVEGHTGRLILERPSLAPLSRGGAPIVLVRERTSGELVLRGHFGVEQAGIRQLEGSRRGRGRCLARSSAIVGRRGHEIW